MEASLNEGNREQSARLSHKMVPLFTMLGATSLVEKLRSIEKNAQSMAEEEWRNQLSEVIAEIKNIIAQATSLIQTFPLCQNGV